MKTILSPPIRKFMILATVLTCFTVFYKLLEHNASTALLTNEVDFVEKTKEVKKSIKKISAEAHHSPNLPLNLVALILARGGSKGIPKKNLVTIGNYTLLGRSLKTINEFGRFSSVWVSTDHKQIGKEAKLWGAQVHWRSAESATDIAPSLLGVQDFLAHHPEVDIIGLIQCTSPFLKSSFLNQAYTMVIKGEYDSVFAASRSHDLRWKLHSDGSISPLNFEPRFRPRRQDWPGELVENGMFYFASAELIHRGLLQGERCGVVEIPKNYSLEINTRFDLQVAQLHLASHLLK